MKQIWKWALALFAAAALSATLTACGSDSDSADAPAKYQGQWIEWDEDGYGEFMFELKSGGRGFCYEGEPEKGYHGKYPLYKGYYDDIINIRWKVDEDDLLYIIYPDDSDETEVFEIYQVLDDRVIAYDNYGDLIVFKKVNLKMKPNPEEWED